MGVIFADQERSVPLNPQIETLSDYPFEALRTLLNPVAAVVNDPPILMSLGEPQHQPPALLAETLAAHAHEWNKYPPMAGTPELRQAIADWLTRRYRLPAGALDPDWHIANLAGTKEGLYLFSSLVVPRRKDPQPTLPRDPRVKPGEGRDRVGAGSRPVVLVPNPYYLVYNGAATMAGAEAVFLDATRENAFMPDLAAIPPETLERTALFYLCSPANPQGMIAGLDYLKQAIALARRHDFVLAVDECYAEIYDRVPPPGALEACTALGEGFDNVVVFHSLSKRSSAAGLRSGFVAGDPDLIRRLKMLRNYAGASLPIPILAASAALWRDETHVEDNRALYRRKFDLADQIMTGRYGYYRPAGGFYLWLDVGDGEAAAATLWERAALRVMPGVYLARPGADGRNPGAGYIRCALVHDLETTALALERLRNTL